MKTKTKYQVVCNDYEHDDCLFDTLKAAEDYAKDLIRDGSNETAEIFKLVSVKKFKLDAVPASWMLWK